MDKLIFLFSKFADEKAGQVVWSSFTVCAALIIALRPAWAFLIDIFSTATWFILILGWCGLIFGLIIKKKKPELIRSFKEMTASYTNWSDSKIYKRVSLFGVSVIGFLGSIWCGAAFVFLFLYFFRGYL